MKDYEGDLPNELWKSVPGFEDYEASSLGRIRIKESVYHGSRNRDFYTKKKILKQTQTKDRHGEVGYLNIRLTRNGERKTYPSHRIIALAFIPNPYNLPTVNHKNGIKNDNRIQNLEWSSYSDNNMHAYKNSLKPDNKKIVSINSLNNHLIDIYYSISEAERMTQITRNSISKALDKNVVISDLVFWSYEKFKTYLNNNGGIAYEYRNDKN